MRSIAWAALLLFASLRLAVAEAPRRAHGEITAGADLAAFEGLANTENRGARLMRHEDGGGRAAAAATTRKSPAPQPKIQEADKVGSKVSQPVTKAHTSRKFSSSVATKEAKEFFNLLLQTRNKGYTCKLEVPYGTEGNITVDKYLKVNQENLVFDCRLWRALKQHSEEMATLPYWGNYNPLTGEGTNQRVAKAGTVSSGEEILAWTQESGTGLKVLDMLMKSGPQCLKLMDPANVRFAAERVFSRSDDGWYWSIMLETNQDGIPPQGCLR